MQQFFSPTKSSLYIKKKQESPQDEQEYSEHDFKFEYYYVSCIHQRSNIHG
jgi:hypothetical protein